MGTIFVGLTNFFQFEITDNDMLHNTYLIIEIEFEVGTTADPKFDEDLGGYMDGERIGCTGINTSVEPLDCFIEKGKRGTRWSKNAKVIVYNVRTVTSDTIKISILSIKNPTNVNAEYHFFATIYQKFTSSSSIISFQEYKMESSYQFTSGSAIVGSFDTDIQLNDNNQALNSYGAINTFRFDSSFTLSSGQHYVLEAIGNDIGIYLQEDSQSFLTAFQKNNKVVKAKFSLFPSSASGGNYVNENLIAFIKPAVTEVKTYFYDTVTNVAFNTRELKNDGSYLQNLVDIPI